MKPWLNAVTSVARGHATATRSATPTTSRIAVGTQTYNACVCRHLVAPSGCGSVRAVCAPGKCRKRPELCTPARGNDTLPWPWRDLWGARAVETRGPTGRGEDAPAPTQLR